MLNFEPEVLMNEEEYQLIRDLIYNHCGIFFDNASKFLLEKRLNNRLKIHDIPTFKEYYYFLKYGKEKEKETTEITDILTTNETYFFREDFQLKAFSNEIIPELIEVKKKEGKKLLRIWSAGCSTGEEPYTIAMLALDAGILKDFKVEIYACDISNRVLNVARKGIYSKSSFRATDEKYVRKYFVPEDDGRLRIADEPKKLVTFGYMNLLDSQRMNLIFSMDVIFCRNVIIYFDVKAKKKVVESFYERLNPGGYLLLGHSESLINITNLFELRHLKNDLVYRKAYKHGR